MYSNPNKWKRLHAHWWWKVAGWWWLPSRAAKACRIWNHEDFNGLTPANLSNEILVRIGNKVIGNITTPLPKKGNVCIFQNYRTISLISHSGTVMLIVTRTTSTYKLEDLLLEEHIWFRQKFYLFIAELIVRTKSCWKSLRRGWSDGLDVGWERSAPWQAPSCRVKSRGEENITRKVSNTAAGWCKWLDRLSLNEMYREAEERANCIKRVSLVDPTDFVGIQDEYTGTHVISSLDTRAWTFVRHLPKHCIRSRILIYLINARTHSRIILWINNVMYVFKTIEMFVYTMVMQTTLLPI